VLKSMHARAGLLCTALNKCDRYVEVEMSIGEAGGGGELDEGVM
jgi:hypothetical protein